MEILILAGIAGLFIAALSNDTFVYKEKHGEWRAYFRKEPKRAAHILRDGDGCYVCWNRPLKTKREAEQVAKQWLKVYGK